jgi:hypothetical protein
MRNAYALTAFAVMALVATVFAAPAFAGGVLMLDGTIYDDVNVKTVDAETVVFTTADGEEMTVDRANVRAVFLTDGPIDWASLFPEPPSPESVVNKLMEAFAAGDVDAAAALVIADQRERAIEEMTDAEIPMGFTWELGEVVYGDSDGVPMAAVSVTIEVGGESDHDWIYVAWEGEGWWVLIDKPEGVDVDAWRRQAMVWSVYSSATTFLSLWQEGDFESLEWYMTPESYKHFIESQKEGGVETLNGWSVEDLRIGDEGAAVQVSLQTSVGDQLNWVFLTLADGVWRIDMAADFTEQLDGWVSYHDTLFPVFELDAEPKDVLVALFTAEAAADLPAFLACFDAESVTALAEVTADDLGEIASYEIGESSYTDEGNVMFDVVLTSNDGDTMTRTFVLVYTEDGWKVSIELSDAANEDDDGDDDDMDDDE